MAEMLTLSAVLLPAAGRFWDPDSDSECEDLGDAEELHPPESCSPVPPRTDTAVTALPMTVSPVYADAPGQATMEISLERSIAARPQGFRRLPRLGIFLPPALRTEAGLGAATRSTGFPDPVLSGDRVCSPDLPQQGILPTICNDPIGQRPTSRTPVHLPSRPPPQGSPPPSGCRCRLVNVTVPQHLLSPTPYRDALMARRGRFRRRGSTCDASGF
jgi:hypothetical protein